MGGFRELADADAAYGALTATLLAAAPNLKWIQCPMAAPPESYFIPELIQREERFQAEQRAGCGIHRRLGRGAAAEG